MLVTVEHYTCSEAFHWLRWTSDVATRIYVQGAKRAVREILPPPLGLIKVSQNFRPGIISSLFSSVQFSRSVVSDSLRPHAARQASLSIANSQSLLKLMSIASSHLIFCRRLLLLVAVLENMPHIFYLIWASPTKRCHVCAHFTGEKCSERLHCPCTLT